MNHITNHVDIKNKMLASHIDKNKMLKITLSLVSLYGMIFTLALSFASIFLRGIFSNNTVSAIFLFSYIITLYFSLRLIKKINKYHSFKTSLYILSVTFISSVMLNIGNNTTIILIFFPLLIMGIFLLWTLINLFIEDFTDLRKTGAVQGIKIAIFHISMIAGLLMGSFIISNTGNHHNIFLLISILHIPILFILKKYYKHRIDPIYRNADLKTSINKIIHNKNLRPIFVSAFGLEFFFVIVNIFLPIHLVKYIGVPLIEYFAILLPIALLPYIFIPFIIQDISLHDKWHKKMLIIGYSIMFVIAGIIALLTSKNVFLWAIIMLISRIGASMVDIMNNTLFYKNIHKDDIGSVNLFSNLVVISGVVGTIVTTTILTITDNIIILFLTYLIFGIYILKNIIRIKI